MTIRFRPLASIFGVLFLAIASAWMFASDVMLSQWGVLASEQTGLVGRRGAAMYAGIGVMFLLARNAGASPARAALVSGIVTVLVLLAVLGVFEFATGHATAGILPAVLLEVGLAIAFLRVSPDDAKARPIAGAAQ